MSTLWQGLGLTGMLACIPFLSTNTARVRFWLSETSFTNQPPKNTTNGQWSWRSWIDEIIKEKKNT